MIYILCTSALARSADALVSRVTSDTSARGFRLARKHIVNSGSRASCMISSRRASTIAFDPFSFLAGQRKDHIHRHHAQSHVPKAISSTSARALLCCFEAREEGRSGRRRKRRGGRRGEESSVRHGQVWAAYLDESIGRAGVSSAVYFGSRGLTLGFDSIVDKARYITPRAARPRADESPLLGQPQTNRRRPRSRSRNGQPHRPHPRTMPESRRRRNGPTNGQRSDEACPRQVSRFFGTVRGNQGLMEAADRSSASWSLLLGISSRPSYRISTSASRIRRTRCVSSTSPHAPTPLDSLTAGRPPALLLALAPLDLLPTRVQTPLPPAHHPHRRPHVPTRIRPSSVRPTGHIPLVPTERQRSALRDGGTHHEGRQGQFPSAAVGGE